MKIKVKITTNENMKFYGCEKNTIKEIELEDYVAIVVASEMGNAPTEALKAQAIASRTYACAQGVLNGKVIVDNASKAQAFRAPRYKYKNAQTATKATEGMVLMYGGRYASTYFSQSNGGRTYSSEEVWGGKRPYLIARKDEWNLQKKNGHGVGMSQSGAVTAAEKGIRFKEILSFYYPYTTLKQIEIKQEDYTDIIKQAEQAVKKALKEIGETL